MRAGIIADDFTGATDIASFLANNGIATSLFSGVPGEDYQGDARALVVSLKSRSVSAKESVTLSLSALHWLQQQGCDRFYFKYCSTFDSTRKGNIGPVTDALMDALGVATTIISPALPINGRTVYQGHLFVEDRLLQESGMRNHPVNPMDDSDLRRLMERQSRGTCALINAQILESGEAAVRDALQTLSAAGYRYIALDALNEKHLQIQGQALHDMKLVTGGSGLAAGLARCWANATEPSLPFSITTPAACTVVLSGSCSMRTQAQVEKYRQLAPALAVDVAGLLDKRWTLDEYCGQIVEWLHQQSDAAMAPMVYATTSVAELHNIQQRYGAEPSRLIVETLFSQLAKQLAQQGVSRFIVAGGETSGAVTQALDIRHFTIGAAVSPGVPWIKADSRPLFLLLKSGNFGDDNFFARAQTAEACA
ncbi:TPA: four-carbon acid sugar kinase family protein [Klebsiella aerogenes]|uniref:3-oxo-tetronate kinase n=1 Tax=Klebsiella aerogenes TaxID=548 RepID=UPI00063CB159|nr:3-oxo-tetronate kinase [Klebsiella aerogenes]EKU6155030.1 four-carbon acid sugar kinase family protein [Klebsiella aerogenes]EKZ5663636.1 four-carbon acid sugar kinase family protein [Klebsiella aerogenes]KLF38831.1 membrane protein [Klebsiella aerogenes]PVF78008.1 hypothetical protein CSC18_2719 [Klebsiella aerogenes]RNT30161.1 four-carbon acid sugar kinase family protein [Klebsiella aerogenes]